MTDFTLKLVTPLWTGGSQIGEMDRVHETSLIGTLRWWYEAIVRSFGCYACSPTDQPCELDRNAFNDESVHRIEVSCKASHSGEKIKVGKYILCQECLRKILADGGLCPVCQLFGSTGWRRKFNLTVDDSNLLRGDPFSEVVYEKDEQPRKGMVGILKVSFESRLRGDTQTISLLLGLVNFIQHYGFLGAKTVASYGVCDWENAKPDETPEVDDFINLIRENCSSGQNTNNSFYPNLSYMFFGKRNVTSWGKADFEEFKNSLRSIFDDCNLDDIQQNLFGVFIPEAKIIVGSKIKYGYRNDIGLLKYFGWISLNLLGDPQKHKADKIMQLFKELSGQEKHDLIQQWSPKISAEKTLKKLYGRIP